MIGNLLKIKINDVKLQIPAIRVKGGSRRDSWGIEGHSENPFITRNKRYELVERDHLGKRHHLTIRSIAN